MMAKPPSANSLLRNMKKSGKTTIAPSTPIASNMHLPNNSGDYSKGRVNTTPTTDYEIANKKYVDDKNVESFPTTLTAGSVVFSNGSNLAEDNSNLFWDDTNNTLGIGTTAEVPLEVDNPLQFSLTETNDNLLLTSKGGGVKGAGNYGASIGWPYIGAGGVRRQAAIASVQHTSDVDSTGLAFFTHANTSSNNDIAERMRITHLGRVGIGTTSPTAPLTVKSEGDPSDMFALKNDNGTKIFALRSNSAGQPFFRLFNDSGTERVRLHAASSCFISNNLGVGTTTPDTRLQVVGDCKFGDDNTNYMEVGTTGDVVFVGGAGLCYGEISATNNSTETTITSAGTAVQVTIFDTNGPSNNTTPDHTNDHITIDKAGHYMINVSATINSVAGAGSRFEITCKKNNGASEIICHMDRDVGGGGSESGVISMNGIADLATNDTVEIWIENETNTQNYIIEDICVSLFQLGGT